MPKAWNQTKLKAQRAPYKLEPGGTCSFQYLISTEKEEVGGGVVAAPFFHVIVTFRQSVADHTWATTSVLAFREFHKEKCEIGQRLELQFKSKLTSVWSTHFCWTLLPTPEPPPQKFSSLAFSWIPDNDVKLTKNWNWNSNQNLIPVEHYWPHLPTTSAG